MDLLKNGKRIINHGATPFTIGMANSGRQHFSGFEPSLFSFQKSNSYKREGLSIQRSFVTPMESIHSNISSHSTDSTSILFGSLGISSLENKKVFQKRSHVSDPGYTFRDYFNQMVTLFDTKSFDNSANESNNPSWSISQRVQMGLGVLKLSWEGVKLFRYLPGISQKRVLGYLASFQFLKDLYGEWRGKSPLAKGLVIRKLVSYAGAPVTKLVQDRAQALVGVEVSELEKQEKALQQQLKGLRTTYSALSKHQESTQQGHSQNPLFKKHPSPQKKSLSEEKEGLKNQIEDLVQELSTVQRLKWQKITFGPMLSQVPPLPYKALEKEIQPLIFAFHQAYPTHQIIGVNPMPVGSGSIAQCYEAQLSKPLDGEDKVILKVFRNEVSPDFLTQYDDFLYRLHLILMGTEDPAGADELAHKSVQVLRDEIHPEREKQLSEALIQAIEAEGMTNRVFVPKVYSTGPRGMVIQYAPGENMETLPLLKQQHVLHQRLGDLLKLSVLFPALHLDPHGGNLRVKLASDGMTLEKFSLIDFGRGALLNQDAHQSFLALHQALFQTKGKEAEGASVERVAGENPVLKSFSSLFPSVASQDPQQMEGIEEVVEEFLEPLYTGITLHPFLLSLIQAQEQSSEDLGEAFPSHLKSPLLPPGISGKDVVKGYNSLASLLSLVAFESDEKVLPDAEVLKTLQQKSHFEGVEALAFALQSLQHFAKKKSVFPTNSGNPSALPLDGLSEVFWDLRGKMPTWRSFMKLPEVEKQPMASLLWQQMETDFPEKPYLMKLLRVSVGLGEMAQQLASGMAKHLPFDSPQAERYYKKGIEHSLRGLCYGEDPTATILSGAPKEELFRLNFNPLFHRIQSILLPDE
ncbi:MAG: hypothetical protein K2X66_05205 [Cyanobacteria bacterium]|nr:hypothetical protein [Cyanobacteriota bacterium]